MFATSNRASLPNIGMQKIVWTTDPRLLLILLAVCEKNIVRYVVHIISMLPVIGNVSDAIVPVAYILLFIAYIQKYESHVFFEACCVFMFIVLSIFLSCNIYPENAIYILDSNNFWNTIFPCLRFFFVGMIFFPKREIMDIVGKASCLAIVVETLFVVVYMMPRGLMVNDDMSRSYQILPNVLLTINYAFSSKKIFAWCCSVVGFLYCLSMGTRGAIVVIFCFAFFRILYSIPVETWKKISVAALISGLVIFLLNSSFYLSMLRFTSDVMSTFGLSTRIVDMAIYGEVTSYYSGRDELYNVAIEKIAENPIWGYGVYGEWPWFHWNAHNMYLELLIHYGVIIGLLILFWLFYIVARSYFKTKNSIAKEIILIWACFVFVRGVFGGSYLSFEVFFLVGFCFGELRRIKKECT